MECGYMMCDDNNLFKKKRYINKNGFDTKKYPFTPSRTFSTQDGKKFDTVQTSFYKPAAFTYGSPPKSFTVERSYGVIAFHVDVNEPDVEKRYKFCLYKRRDTYEYLDFLRGAYRKNDLKSFFSLMTEEERDRIKNYIFKDLYYDAWFSKTSYYYKHPEAFHNAQQQFINNQFIICDILNSTKSEVKDQEWGFPKGKRDRFRTGKEAAEEAAVREFFEETAVDLEMERLEDAPSFLEEFCGSDGKEYSTEYFLFQSKEMKVPEPIEIESPIREKSITTESSEVRWVTLDEASELLCPRKMDILKQAYEKIKEIT
jgi:8-oxo-dGTP pyrophosphatase MutT (NUDIX family)